jgi:hypothetical protein
VDALAYVGLIIDKMIAGSTARELHDEEYAEEYENSGLAEEGRSIHRILNMAEYELR